MRKRPLRQVDEGGNSTPELWRGKKSREEEIEQANSEIQSIGSDLSFLRTIAFICLLKAIDSSPHPFRLLICMIYAVIVLLH
jgi:hypothetical protein